MRLANKVAVITGAAAGIGRASALLFGREGARIVAVDRDAERLQEVVTAINYADGHAIGVPGDVSKAADCAAMIEAAKSRFGRLDILFNNAGIIDADDSGAVETPEEIWDKTMTVNLKSVFLGCKYGIPALLENSGGSIINTASAAAVMGSGNPSVAYTASKGGVLAFTREIAIAHGKQNIRANAICPGPMRTEMLMGILDTEEKRERRLVHLPMGRFGEAEEIASAALFLASPDSSYITASAFLVDGGMHGAYITAL